MPPAPATLRVRVSAFDMQHRAAVGHGRNRPRQIKTGITNDARMMARGRDLLERRRLRGHRAPGDAEVGFQCGFCTPGFLLMTKELLEQEPHPTDDQIRHYLSGNLCRCASYPEILKAVTMATGTAPEKGARPIAFSHQPHHHVRTQ